MIRTSWVVLVVAILVTACGGTPDEGARATPSPTAPTATVVAGTIRLYTSVTQDTVDAVLTAYRDRYPGVEVELFRAPTGELTARVAAEQREGRIRADVLWLTDPLSMHQYEADGTLRRWEPDNADAVPTAFHTDASWGNRLVNVVIVHRPELDPAPASWRALAEARYDRPVALPDPGFAGSAFGALAYFGLEPGFGFDYYQRLQEAGAVQVQAPGDVLTGVAEGRFAAGMTLDKLAQDAIDQGSPIAVVYPDPGAIALYSPIAVLEDADDPAAAESFVDFTLSREAQEAIASTGWQPVREDVPWPQRGRQVTPDWDAAFQRQEELLERYRAVFGG